MSIVLTGIPCFGIPCQHIWNQQPHLSRLLYKQMSVVLIRIPCLGVPYLEHIWDGNGSTSIKTSLNLEGTNRLPEPPAVQDGDKSTSIKIHPNLVSPPATWTSSSLLYKQMSIVLTGIPCFGIPCQHIWNQDTHLSRLLYKQMSVVLSLSTNSYSSNNVYTMASPKRHVFFIDVGKTCKIFHMDM